MTTLKWWRRALGIEPSPGRADPATGFEDRGPHQRTLPSARIRRCRCIVRGASRARKATALAALAALAGSMVAPRPAAGGAPCVIVEGVGIGSLRIGQGVAEALAAAGGATQEHPAGRETVYTLRPPWAELAAVGGRVARVSTRSSECRTARGLGVGSPAAAVRAVYAREPASVVVAVPGGDLLSYPFAGIRFLLSGDRVAAVEVLPAERLSRTPATPAPAATTTPGVPSPAATGWTVGRVFAVVEDLRLVVSGVVTNHGRPQAAYAEVRALGPDGAPVAQGDAPLTPTPVPAGGTATFEVRLAIDTVVRRYVVAIRPAGSLTATLADAVGEITNLQQFAGIVARQLQIAVAVQAAPPTRNDFLVVVTNGSGVVVASVAVAAEVTVTCRIAVPTPRIIQEVRTGSAVIVQIRPGGQGRAPLPLSPGACAEFATWTASTRVGEIRIGE